MIFKLHKSNLPQIKAVVKKFGVCYIHGDGNLYTGKEESDFRKDFSNPNSEEATYRVKFENINDVPETIEDLQALMMKAKNQETLDERRVEEISSVKTISVEPDTDEAETSEENTSKRGRPAKQ
jgi:hypothetical protein